MKGLFWKFFLIQWSCYFFSRSKTRALLNALWFSSALEPFHHDNCRRSTRLIWATFSIKLINSSSRASSCSGSRVLRIVHKWPNYKVRRQKSVWPPTIPPWWLCASCCMSCKGGCHRFVCLLTLYFFWLKMQFLFWKICFFSTSGTNDLKSIAYSLRIIS